MTIQIAVTANGRLSLPANIRQHLGLDEGGTLIVEMIDGGVVLRSLAQSVACAQALARQYTDSKAETSVDGFLANRRSEGDE